MRIDSDDEAGLELVEVDVEDPHAGEHAVFVARRPPASLQPG